MSQERLRRFLTQRLQFTSLLITATLTLLLLIKSVSGLWGTAWIVFASSLLTCCWGATRQLFRVPETSEESSLRCREVFVFACSFATQTCLMFGALEAASRMQEFDRYLLAIRELLLVSVVLVMIYGVAIPNRTRRALSTASTLAAIPAAAVAVSLFVHAAAFAEFSTALRLQFAFESMIPLTAGVCCATVGAGLSEKIRDRIINIEELGSYVLKEPLGSGGMGDVYLAEHRLLKRLCAIKLIHPDKAGDSRVRTRFEQEVKATAGLTHPNTVQVYDYGTTDDGRFFYAMEFLEGMNLEQYVLQFGSMPPGRVIYLLRQVCGALHEAWCEGLVHRDIKPSNIYLSERGHLFDVAKLLDFGLVQPALQQEVGVRRVQKQIQGSPAFMCPEQATGIEPDCRGDIYSLGAVAWFMLTASPPFHNDNPLMLIVAHATQPVPEFSATGVNVPADLAAVIRKCLAKKPEDRFDNPRDLLAALEECVASDEWTWKEAEDWWISHFPPSGDDCGPASDASSVFPHRTQSATRVSDCLEKTIIFDRDLVTEAEPVS